MCAQGFPFFTSSFCQSNIHNILNYKAIAGSHNDIVTANTTKELMQQQWSELVKPGCGVNVK